MTETTADKKPTAESGTMQPMPNPDNVEKRSRSTNRTLYAAVAVLILLTAVPVLRLTGGDTGLRIPILGAIALITVFVVAKDHGSMMSPNVAVAGSAFIACGAVSNLMASDRYQWITFAAFAGVAVTGIVLGASVAAHNLVRPVFQWVIGIAAAQCAYAVYEVLVSADPLWRGARVLPDGESVAIRSELIEGFTRAQGTLGHPLVLAALTLMAVTLTIATDAVPRTPARLTLLAVFTAGILASGSRNAVLLLGALLVILWGAKSGRVMAARAVFFGIPIGAIAGILAIARIGEFFDSGSYSHRAGAFEVIPRLFDIRGFLTTVFGDGSASTPRLQTAGLLQSDRFIAIDNQVLLLFIQYGLAGVLLVMGLFVAALRRDQGTARIVIAVWVVQFFVFDVLAWPSSAFLVWLAVGIAVSNRKVIPSVDAQDLPNQSTVQEWSEPRVHDVRYFTSR